MSTSPPQEDSTNASPCHNCRRQRRKCDRSLPQCRKCGQRGQECLGYGKLYLWQQGVASRGKMMGKKLQQPAREVGSPALAIQRIEDPLLQDLTPRDRNYLFYFTKRVCKELVLYDVPDHNRFRDLVPLAQHNPVLFHAIVAISALHISNASRACLAAGRDALPLRVRSGLAGPKSYHAVAFEAARPYRDALAARQCALYLLRCALNGSSPVDVDVILAVVLLFIEFELVDSGRDGWVCHVNGAKSLIESHCTSQLSTEKEMSPLRACLISNCLVYVSRCELTMTLTAFGTDCSSSFNILGSTLTASHSARLPAGSLSLMHDEEGNHCSSIPSALLMLLQAGSQLLALGQQESDDVDSHPIADSSRFGEALAILRRAQQFDPLAWADGLRKRSPTAEIDFPDRQRIARAHHLAACIYLARVVLFFDPEEQGQRSRQSQHEVQVLAGEALAHLALISTRSALFTATAWPTFVAGAETDSDEWQAWVAGRFCDLWDVEPWGLIRGALEVLHGVWAGKEGKKDAAGVECGDSDNIGSSSSSSSPVKHSNDRTIMEDNWVVDMRRKGVSWLIF